MLGVARHNINKDMERYNSFSWKSRNFVFFISLTAYTIEKRACNIKRYVIRRSAYRNILRVINLPSHFSTEQIFNKYKLHV